MSVKTSIENHNLRSAEVKEVLVTQPKFSILFGNSFVVIILCCFLAFLNFHKVPSTVMLQFRLQDLAKNNNDGSYDLSLLMDAPLNMKTNSIKQAKVTFILKNGGRTKEIAATIKQIDQNKSAMIIEVSSNNLYLNYQNESDKIGENQFGTLKLQTDSISLYKLFIRKVVAQNDFFN